MQKRLQKNLIKLLFFGLIIIAKVLFWFSKLTRLGSGTSLPGLLVEKFCPFIITKITQDLEQIILISGTNGKTTTRALLVHIWEEQDFEVCTNRGGANILRGIAATLLLNYSFLGKMKSSIAILEVEEATLPILTKYLVPNQLILTNIFRDQLDAYGEIDQTLSYFSQSLSEIQKNQNLLQNQQQNWQNNQDLSKNSINKKIKNQKPIQNWQIDEENIHQNDNLIAKFGKNKLKIASKISQKYFSWQEKITDLPKIKIEEDIDKQKLTNKSTKNSKDKLSNQKSNQKSKQGFKGLFGRQFPSQNIYESDFKNSILEPVIPDIPDPDTSDFNNSNNYKTLNVQNNLARENELINVNLNPNFNSKISETTEKNSNPKNNSQNYNNEQNFEQINQILSYKKSTFNKLPQTQIIVNVDDSKLLTCLRDCVLPIIGFGIATDFDNKPSFEKNENPFIPSFEEQFVAQSIAFRNQISRFVIPIEQTELSIESNLPGFFNLYNTVATIASSYHIFGKKIIPNIASFEPVFGRGEIIDLKNNQISLYLVKNPAGFEQVLDLIVNKNKENNQISLYQKNQTMSPISKNCKFNLGFLINDKIADGKDLSWLWDVNFEEFEQNIGPTKIMTGGIRGADLLLRLEQAGFDINTENYQKNITEFLDKIEKSGEDWIICATYTAMMEFRNKISKKTKLKKINESGF